MRANLMQMVVGLSLAGAGSAMAATVGFDYAGKTAAYPGGDELGTRLFVHQHAMPSDGQITSVHYANDSDSIAEAVEILILRPVSAGWNVVHRIALAVDDTPSAQTSGSATFTLVDPLTVQSGDVFGHWHAGSHGPIPFSIASGSTGASIHRIASSGELDSGDVVSSAGFYPQTRDYFINLQFEPAEVPEPSMLMTGVLGLAGLGLRRRVEVMR